MWNGEDALPKQYCGRGTVNVLMNKGDKDFVYNHDIEEMITPLDQAERRWLAQARRLRELARLRARLFADSPTADHAEGRDDTAPPVVGGQITPTTFSPLDLEESITSTPLADAKDEDSNGPQPPPEWEMDGKWVCDPASPDWCADTVRLPLRDTQPGDDTCTVMRTEGNDPASAHQATPEDAAIPRHSTPPCRGK